MHSEGQRKIGPMLNEKAKSFYDEIQINDKCTFSTVRMKNFRRTSS